MKATWLWDTEMIGTPEGRASILQFAQEHALGRIYVQVNGDVSRSAYSDFIGTASESGIQVHALDGAPKWALPSHRKQLTDMVSWVTEYNRSVQPDERFGGIQIDIEPYQLPEWSTKQDAVTAQWLDATAAFASEARKQDASLTVSAALPFWLDTVTVPETGQTAIEGMMKQLDEVTLMSYRDSAEALIEITAAEMALGDKLGIKVFVGVETNPVNEAAFVTFHSKGKGEMGRQMAVIDQKLSAHPSYSGIAIHDYSGWKRLKD
ncbi:hypothetical protein DVH26_03680 [Paenibacillus sp. H1-7]|nr:hypothetical protein DVH26_03680 [Paenibacillus sp. H1-7]